MCTVPIFGITYTCDYMYLSSIFKHLCIYIDIIYMNLDQNILNTQLH